MRIDCKHLREKKNTYISAKNTHESNYANTHTRMTVKRKMKTDEKKSEIKYKIKEQTENTVTFAKWDRTNK